MPIMDAPVVTGAVVPKELACFNCGKPLRPCRCHLVAPREWPFTGFVHILTNSHLCGMS